MATLKIIVIISKTICVLGSLSLIAKAVYEKDADETIAWIAVFSWIVKDIVIEYFEEKYAI